MTGLVQKSDIGRVVEVVWGGWRGVAHAVEWEAELQCGPATHRHVDSFSRYIFSQIVFCWSCDTAVIRPEEVTFVVDRFAMAINVPAIKIVFFHESIQLIVKMG